MTTPGRGIKERESLVPSVAFEDDVDSLKESLAHVRELRYVLSVAGRTGPEAEDAMANETKKTECEGLNHVAECDGWCHARRNIAEKAEAGDSAAAEFMRKWMAEEGMS